jgi:hypothetical protein
MDALTVRLEEAGLFFRDRGGCLLTPLLSPAAECGDGPARSGFLCCRPAEILRQRNAIVRHR